jgi:hypothetical protein
MKEVGVVVKVVVEDSVATALVGNVVVICGRFLKKVKSSQVDSSIK